MIGWVAARVLVVAFLIGYVAPYLSPEYYWWIDLFAVLLPPLALAVGILGAWMLAFGVYQGTAGRVIVAVGLLGLVLIRFGSQVLPWPTRAPSGDAMRLMTFNVPATPLDASRGAARLSDLLRSEEPDVLALQESWVISGSTPRSGIDRTSRSLEQLQANPVNYRPPATLPPKTRLYQPVFGRAFLDSLSAHRVPSAEEEDSVFRYSRTVFRWEGRPVVLYNLHLNTVGEVRPWDMAQENWLSPERWDKFLDSYREGALRRAEQARAIRSRVEREKHPVIVVGDFNSTPHQWVYGHLADGLHDAARDGTWGRMATFPAESPLVQIDHVVVGPALQATSAHVPEYVEVDGISDHRPLVVELQWRD